MNEDTLKSIWDDIHDKVKRKWKEFTDEDMNYINGSKDKLIEKLSEKYHYSHKKAQAEWNNFYNRISDTMDDIKEEASSSINHFGDSIHNFVKNSPIKALGFAALAGLIVGLRF